MSDVKKWLHVDMDSYFASCEQQANPFLRGKPIGVVGNPYGGKAYRSVIAACSREAKKFGVKSGMPPYKAKKLCPNLLLVPADRAKYEYVTRRAVKIFSRYAPEPQLFSIDEAFLDITQTQGSSRAYDVACRLQCEVKSAFGGYITCSVGIGPNRFLAKVASEIKKPGGVFEISKENQKEVFSSLNLEDVFGIGVQTRKKLKEIGIQNLEELASAPPGVLREKLGMKGESLKRLAQGKESACLSRPAQALKHSYHKTKPVSCSRSQTLASDCHSLSKLKSLLSFLSEKVASELRSQNLTGNIVRVNIRYQDFTSFSRQRKLDSLLMPDGAVIFQKALRLLQRQGLEKPVRKAGVAVTGLREHKQPFLFEKEKKREKLLEVKDKINSTMGDNTILPLRCVDM